MKRRFIIYILILIIPIIVYACLNLQLQIKYSLAISAFITAVILASIIIDIYLAKIGKGDYTGIAARIVLLVFAIILFFVILGNPS